MLLGRAVASCPACCPLPPPGPFLQSHSPARHSVPYQGLALPKSRTLSLSLFNFQVVSAGPSPPPIQVSVEDGFTLYCTRRTALV